MTEKALSVDKDRREKRSFFQYCSLTTCHGFGDLPLILQPWVKKLYLATICVSIAILLVQLILLFHNNINGDKWVTTVFEEQNSAPTPLPDVIVCNFNRFMRSKVAAANMSSDLVAYLFAQMIGNYPIVRDHFNKSVVEEYAHWRAASNDGAATTLGEAVGALGQDCDGALVAVVTRAWRTAVARPPCDHPRLRVERVLSSEFGGCLRVHINPLESLEDISLGDLGRVTLILDTQIDEYVDVAHNNYADEGFAIQVSFTAGIRDGDWIAVSPGLHSWVALKRKEHRLRKSVIPLTKADCSDDSGLRILTNEPYTISACAVDCHQWLTAEECGCVRLLTHSRYPTCEADDARACDTKISNSASLMERLASCVGDCRQPCDETSATTSVSTSRFPTAAMAAQLPSHLSEAGQLQSRLAAVNIFYASSSTTVVERYERVTLDQVISSVGGQLGLWAGISVLTIVQAILYWCGALSKRPFDMPDNGLRNR